MLKLLLMPATALLAFVRDLAFRHFKLESGWKKEEIKILQKANENII